MSKIQYLQIQNGSQLYIENNTTHDGGNPNLINYTTYRNGVIGFGPADTYLVIAKKKEIEAFDFAASKFYFVRKNPNKTLMYESLTMASKKIACLFRGKRKKR